MNAVTGLLASLFVMIKSTHRTRANRILHLAGFTCYGLALAIVSTTNSGSWSILVLPAVLWLGGVALFSIGHMIEGNLGTITPVLVSRLLSRKLRNYLATDRVHVHTP